MLSTARVEGNALSQYKQMSVPFVDFVLTFGFW